MLTFLIFSSFPSWVENEMFTLEKHCSYTSKVFLDMLTTVLCDSLTDPPLSKLYPAPCRLLARTCVRHPRIPATCYLTTRARPTSRTSLAERRGEPLQNKREREKKIKHASRNQSRPLNEEPLLPPLSVPHNPRGANVQSGKDTFFCPHRKN